MQRDAKHPKTGADASEASEMVAPWLGPKGAFGVCEDLLARTGYALESGDFSFFVPCFVLPIELDHFGGVTVVNDTADLHRIFYGVRQYFATLGVTKIDRRCLAAELRDDVTIVASHESRYFRDGTLVHEPYPVLSFVRWTGGAWKISSGKYAFVDAPGLEEAFNRIGS